MPGLTSISFVDDLGATPATVNRRTGELFISAKKWKTMTPDQRLFMILHEEGHVVLNTTNEFEADNYAFEQYIKTGSSLKSSVSALTDVLSNDNSEHLERAMQQLKRAKIFDEKKNNTMNPSFNHTASLSIGRQAPSIYVDFNGRRKRRHNSAPANRRSGTGRNPATGAFMTSTHSAPANRVGGSVLNAISNMQSQGANRKGGQVMESIVDTLEMESFGGKFRAKRKEKRENKHELKLIKAESKATKRTDKSGSKAYKREAKGDKKRLNGESNLELAKLGINGRAQLAGSVLGGMAKVAGAVGGSIVGAGLVKQLPNMLGKGGGSNEDQVADYLTEGLQLAGGALGAKTNEQDPYAKGIEANYNNAKIVPISSPAPIVDISPEDKKKDSTMMFVGIGAAVLVVVLLLVFMKK